MIKYLYVALTIITYHSNYAPEEIIQTSHIIHVSTSDESFIRSIKKLHNKFGTKVGQYSHKFYKKTNIDLGFGDVHNAQKLLTKTNKTAQEDKTLIMHMNNMDAHEKTAAFNHARKQSIEPQDVSAKAFHLISDHEVIEKNDDGSITVHDLDTFGTPQSMTQKKFDIATKIIEQYIQDASNIDLQRNAQKIINNTGYLRVATPAERAQLIPHYFELSKLADNPKKFRDKLFESNKSNPSTKKLIDTTIQKYFESSHDNPDESLDLFDMLSDQEKTEFLKPYLGKDFYEQKIMQLIGQDCIIIDNVICNIHKPTFASEQQAIDAAKKLCNKKDLTDAQAIALRNILQALPYEKRSLVLEKYSQNKRYNILKRIKKDGEIIVNNQILNIKNPDNSLFTQSFSDFAMSSITTLLRTPQKTTEQTLALESLSSFTYKKNPTIIAKTIDDLSTSEIEELKQQLPKETIIIIHKTTPTILVNPSSLVLTTPLKQQAQSILKEMDIDPADTKATELTTDAIARYFQTQFKIVDITSAQNLCEQLLYTNQPFAPDIFQGILKQLRSPQKEQTAFFNKVITKLTDQAERLKRVIDETPETYQEGYGIAGGTMVKVGIDQEEAELAYIESMKSQFQKLT